MRTLSALLDVEQRKGIFGHKGQGDTAHLLRRFLHAVVHPQQQVVVNAADMIGRFKRLGRTDFPLKSVELKTLVQHIEQEMGQPVFVNDQQFFFMGVKRRENR
jgi:hypothetical protein